MVFIRLGDYDVIYLTRELDCQAGHRGGVKPCVQFISATDGIASVHPMNDPQPVLSLSPPPSLAPCACI